jgi:hypothetical protein
LTATHTIQNVIVAAAIMISKCGRMIANMQSKTIESMKTHSRSRKHRHSQRRNDNVFIHNIHRLYGFTPVVIIVTFIIGLTFVWMVIVITGPSIQQSRLMNISAVESSFSLFNLPSDDDVDLWLDATNRKTKIDPILDVVLRQRMQQSCLPYDNNNENSAPSDVCQTRKDGSTDRVGIIRPPGILGNIFEDCIVKYINQSRADDTGMIVFVQPNPYTLNGERFTWTKILRPVVMPILLEAIDLSLQTTGADFSPDDILLEDILCTIRLLVRWHCRLTQIASNTALLSISMQRLMAYPKEVEQDLTEFLDLHHSRQEKLHLNMDTYAEAVFQRIDVCTTFLRQLRARSRSASISDLLNSVVREELNNEYCSSATIADSFNQISVGVKESRVTDIVGNFLNGSFEVACKRYPQAHACNAAFDGYTYNRTIEK